MENNSKITYFLKAIKEFKRRFIVVTPEFKILAASCPGDQLNESELIGKPCYDVFYNRTAPCEDCAVKQSQQIGKPASIFRPTETLDLKLVPCLHSYPIFSDSDKTIEAFVSLDFDIPILCRLDQKLKQSTSLLRNFIMSAVDGVIAADKKGNIIIFNDAATSVFGYSEEEAVNSLNIRDIYPSNGAYEIMRKLRSPEHGGKGKLKSYRVDVLDKNKNLIPISLNAAIVYEGETEIATIGFFHDLRETLQMKAQIEKIQIQLLQAEKMASLGKLAAGVAHQLNNPLGGITLYTKLILEEYDLPEAVKQDLLRIHKDAERCRDTVKELLEFTRQTRHFMKPHNVNDAILRTLFLLENQTLFHNISIIKELDASLPLVKADIQQLNHLLMNIILNAAQAMKGKGTLTIKTRATPDKDWIVIEISDTGPGIPETVLPYIFEPFFTTKDEGEGTGLGLSLVYSIVENHHGRIEAKNLPDKGAAFIIELPVKIKQNGGNQIGSES